MLTWNYEGSNGKAVVTLRDTLDPLLAGYSVEIWDERDERVYYYQVDTWEQADAIARRACGDRRA